VGCINSLVFEDYNIVTFGTPLMTRSFGGKGPLWAIPQFIESSIKASFIHDGIKTLVLPPNRALFPLTKEGHIDVLYVLFSWWWRWIKTLESGLETILYGPDSRSDTRFYLPAFFDFFSSRFSFRVFPGFFFSPFLASWLLPIFFLLLILYITMHIQPVQTTQNMSMGLPLKKKANHLSVWQSSLLLCSLLFLDSTFLYVFTI